MSAKTFKYGKLFPLEIGATLPSLEIAYHIYGKLNAEKNNVIWVSHALTANSDVFDWWKGLFGDNDFYNPEDHFIVCANNLGSCHGTTGPLSINPDSGQQWFSYFPQITVRDQARTLDVLRQHLGIEKIHTLIGGSLGGQIAQEWVLQNPGVVDNLVIVATNARHSPWGVAFNESQRLAVKADRTYYSNSEEGGQKGLSAARSIALLSYRNYNTYNTTQQESNLNKVSDFASSSYQRYQGEKLVKRFNAYSYVRLSEAMDSHNVARGRNEKLEQALNAIKTKTLVIGISSDLLFPVAEQQFLAKHIPGARYNEIDSFYGHDGFLLETKQLTEVIKQFYVSETNKLKNKLSFI
jgi:homoserine O-acetyltransferase/O-succinyltransferase